MNTVIQVEEHRRETFKVTPQGIDSDSSQANLPFNSPVNSYLTDSNSPPTNTSKKQRIYPVIEELEERKTPKPANDPSLREKLGPVKEKSFDSDETVTVGDPWKTIEFVEHLKLLILSTFTSLNRSKYMLIFFAIYSVCILASGILSVLGYLKYVDEDDQVILGGVVVLHICFGLVALGFIGFSSVKLLRSQWLSANLVQFNFCARVVNVCLGLIASLSLYSQNKSYGLIILGLTFGSGFAYILILAICILGLPFLCLAFIAEAAIRLSQCNLNCPSYERKCRILQYQVFKYTTKAFGDCECVVCLDKFKEEEPAVLLECHVSHMFHENCIMEWLEKSLCCPICRKDVAFVLN
eukprot:TRINITY_DN4568_c0_g2_i5.p1 TRINITY_DN4568_c0_g2~~TRINITY_DN4568_c0_g2_i5.p1  ORF type:complete len:353 (+),score=65.39 TRINITY_DN4568_c0_g2_i5:198-1256(+)